MGAYALIGESLLNQYASKYIQMACFFNHPTLRLRFFDRTSDAFERCLVEEVAMNHSLCEQPKLFMLHDNQDQLCINLDYELSSTSRIHIGYKEVPFAGFWSNRLDRSCFIFNIPNLHAPTSSVGMDQFAVHIDLYQSTTLDSALHTRFYIDRLRVSLHRVRLRRRCTLRFAVSAFTKRGLRYDAVPSSSTGKIIRESNEVIRKDASPTELRQLFLGCRSIFDKS